MLSTHVPMVGFSTTATTSATQQGAWTGLGLRTLTRLCHASVSFLHAYNFLADDTYLPYPTNSFILAVFCDEDKIPPFVNGTEPGTIDWEEKKAGNPKRWNAFQSRLTYTCPIGFVIEVPGGRHDEQQDPIPVDQESFEVGFTLLPSITKQQVECWEDAVWKPIPLHGGHVMPTCIRKLTIQDVLVQYYFPFQQSTAHSHLFPWRIMTLECTIGQLLMEWTPGHMRAP